MNRTLYNACMLTGLVLIGAGVGMVSIPAALCTVGALLIALTVYASQLGGRG